MKATALALDPPSVARAAGLAEAGHIVELDGVRALAIWAVLGAHLIFAAPVTDAGRTFLPRPLAAILAHGWLGVDLFFVLSGFLITSILLRTKGLGRGEYFRRFYLRRTLRILPLYLVVLAVLLVACGTNYATYFALCALLSANLAPFFNAPVPDAAGPFWSLAVEEQFYLVWPWLVLWLDARKLAIASLAVVAIEPFLRAFASESQLGLTWFRADGLAMGAFLATWFALRRDDRRAARTLALSLAGVAVAILIVGLPFGILHEGPASTSFRITQAVCVFGAIVVAAVAFAGHPALAFLRSRVAVTTAALSYCIYLVHRPLVDGFEATVGATGPFTRLSQPMETIVRSAIVIALAYGIAAIARRVLEVPFVRLGRRRS